MFVNLQTGNGSGNLEDWNQVLGDLSQIREVPFSSSVPILGPLIVLMRKCWNWMSTTWYVRPLLQQQNAFNKQVVRSYEDILTGLSAVEASAYAVEQFGVRQQRELARIELRLQRIEAQLAALARQVHSTSVETLLMEKRAEE